MKILETSRTKLRNGRPRQKRRRFVISILRLLPLKTEETTCEGNTEWHPDRQLTPPDTLQCPRLPSPASQFVSVSFAALTSHWRVEETTTNSPAMAGLLVSQSNQNAESQILSPHEDQRPGKIRISLAREKPIKGRGEQTKGGEDPEEEKIKRKHREKIKRKESRREERTGSWKSRNIKKKKRRRGAERESKECFIQHLHLAAKGRCKKQGSHFQFSPSLHFNYSPLVASVREQFTHACK